MLSLITDRWETASRRPLNPGANTPPVLSAVRIILLLTVLATVPLARPHPGLADAHSIAILVAMVVVAVAWVFWLRSRSDYLVTVTALSVMAVAGGALAGLSPFSPAIAIACVVTSSAGVRLSTEASLAITAVTVAAFLVSGFIVGAPAETLAGYPAALIGLWAFGLTRRAYVLRAEDAEAALEQARRAHAAENQAAALAERARIAREIHDVLPACTCRLCADLRGFLADPSRRTLEWPLAQDGRARVEGRIGWAELPVTHATRRPGRPYTLVLTKTDALFTQDLQRSPMRRPWNGSRRTGQSAAETAVIRRRQGADHDWG